MKQRRTQPIFGTILLMRTPRQRTPKKASRAPKAPDEDVALDTALSDVDRFVNSLERRWKRALERHDRAKEGSPAAARAWSLYEEAWADLQEAHQLRDAVRTAGLRARAEVAIVEAEAAVAIAIAFDQFAIARASRRGRAITARAGSPSKKRAASLESPEPLGVLAAKAKEAVVYAVAERYRLAEAMGAVRQQLTEIQQSLSAVGSDGPEVEWDQQRVAGLEAAEACLVREHAVQAAIVDQLLLGLRATFENLPAPEVMFANWLASRRVKERGA